MKALIFIALAIVNLVASAAEVSKNVKGCWIFNSCWYGSTKRPWNLPCQFKVSESDISWKHDRTQLFNLKYQLDENDPNNETLIVFGGSKKSWYSHTSIENAKHKLEFIRNHSNKYAKSKGSIQLRSYFWDESNNKWKGSGSSFIRENGSCEDII